MSNSTAVPTAAQGTTSKSSSKSSKTSRLITLRLSPAALSKFPHEAPIPSQTKSSSASSLAGATPSEAVAASSPSANPDTPDATGSSLGPNAASAKKKGVPGPKPGMKRSNSQLNIDGAPKPRGKPGPKKKARVGENGIVVPGAPAAAAPKLGPKANQGAINACLRALDRTGKPCRKWAKNGFKVKSFTGVAWDTRAWASHRKPVDFSQDVKSDTSSSGDGSGLGGLNGDGAMKRGEREELEGKGTQESSAVASDKSNSGGDGGTPMQVPDITSSPAPFITVEAA